jgi:leucyl aminopeptidase
MALSLTTRVGPDAQAPVDAPVLVVLRADGRFGPRAKALDAQLGGQLTRACGHPKLRGNAAEITDLVAPAGLSARRVLVLDLGPAASLTALATMTAGAAMARRLEAEAEPEAVLLFDPPQGAVGGAEIAARLVLGAGLGAYRFSLKSGQATYRLATSRQATSDEATSDEARSAAGQAAAEQSSAAQSGALALTIIADELDMAALDRVASVSEGVCFARNLVNSPASHLHPENFGAHLAVLRHQAGRWLWSARACALTQAGCVSKPARRCSP